MTFCNNRNLMGNANDNERLKKLLALEAKQQISAELFDRMLEGGEEIALAPYEPMIDAGDFNPNVYIVKEGLIRGTYLDKNTEKTAGFALPGTLLISFHSYYGGAPSYYRYEACCHSVVVRIPKAYFDQLTATSHEFALWVMSAHQNQLYFNELRNHVLSGDAKSRLLQLTRRLSDIIPPPASAAQPAQDSGQGALSHSHRMKNELRNRYDRIQAMVPSKIIASYLGITEQHLSKIKKEMLKEEREGK